jgi:hypothetical protein
LSVGSVPRLQEAPTRDSACGRLMPGFAERTLRMAFDLNRRVPNAGDREAIAAVL